MIGASKLLYWDSLLNLVNGTSALLEKPMWVKQVLWDCSPRDSAPHRLIQWLQCVAWREGYKPGQSHGTPAESSRLQCPGQTASHPTLLWPWEATLNIFKHGLTNGDPHFRNDLYLLGRMSSNWVEVDF